MLLILRKFILPFKTICGSCISVFMIINKCLPSHLLNFFWEQAFNIIRCIYFGSVFIFWWVIFVDKNYEISIIFFLKFFLDIFQIFTKNLTKLNLFKIIKLQKVNYLLNFNSDLLLLSFKFFFFIFDNLFLWSFNRSHAVFIPFILVKQFWLKSFR